MLEKMKNAWRIPELRKKIIYTFGMLLIYRCLLYTSRCVYETDPDVHAEGGGSHRGEAAAFCDC